MTQSRNTDQLMELSTGRRAPYTRVGEWVTLAPISAQAARLYTLLMSHVNHSRGDGTVWPSRATLAAMLGYSRRDKVDPLLRELEALGAIDVVRGRRRPDGGLAPNLYVIHETPPDGYTGHVSLSDWYAASNEHRRARGGPEKRARGGPEKRARGGPEKRARTIPKPEPDEPEPAYEHAPEPAGTVVNDSNRQAGGESEDQAVADSTSTAVSATSHPIDPHAEAAQSCPMSDNPTQGTTSENGPMSATTAAAQLIAELPWPAGYRPDTPTRDRLIDAATACLAAGHPAATVTATAAEGIPGARRPAAVVLTRLRHLAQQQPVVDHQAEREREREAARITPHPVEPGRLPGYCRRCGHHETHRLHQHQAPEGVEAGIDAAVARCEHGRRACLACHGSGRGLDQEPTTAAQPRPAPRPRVADSASVVEALARQPVGV